MDSKQSNGGRARAEKLSPERRSEIASLGAETRWGKAKSKKAQKVYVIGSPDGPVKIGVAECVRRRRSSLQIGSPTELEIFGEFDVGEHSARDVEMAVHFALRATHVRGEWFDVSPERAMSEVKKQSVTLVLPPEKERPLGRRVPFQLRIDQDRWDRLTRVAAQMHLSKTEIVESGIDMRLDLLEGYQKMDRAEPKKVSERRVQKAVIAASAKPSGWDAEGNPIYRGVK